MTSLLIAARRVLATRAATHDTAGGDAARARLLSPGYVRVEDGRIAEVAAGVPSRVPDIDLPDGVLAPGLVDLQVNGCFGRDLADTDPVGWAEVIRRLPETGVTAFQPTFITTPVDRLVTVLTWVRDLLPDLAKPGGARVLGVHLEGPFLSAKRAGAHDSAHFTDPSDPLLDRLLEPGVVRTVTLAPERTGALAAIRRLAAAGILVSIGHSDADAAETEAAARAGARMVTHLFNAQSGVHHRDPGVAAQALVDPGLTAGLILDLHHVAPAVCRLAFEAAAGRIALVTDAVSAAGMPPGRYELGGGPIDLPPGGPPLRADGTLAGSALRLDTAIGNAVGLGIPLTTAVDAASRIPADLIGRPELGRIAPGAMADLVWLDDRLRTRRTWIDGSPAFVGGS